MLGLELLVLVTSGKASLLQYLFAENNAHCFSFSVQRPWIHSGCRWLGWRVHTRSCWGFTTLLHWRRGIYVNWSHIHMQSIDLSIVGYCWCKARLHSQCLPHHSALPVWKVIMLSCCKLYWCVIVVFLYLQDHWSPPSLELSIAWRKHVNWSAPRLSCPKFKPVVAKLLLSLYVLMPSIFFSLLGRSVKTHLYWSMLNCKCDPQKLCRLIENIPNHYQVWLLKLCCSLYLAWIGQPLWLSRGVPPCRHSEYQPGKVVISNPQGSQALLSTLKQTYIYKYAKDFCRVSWRYCSLIKI